ncbi:flagellar hook-length control protein FliK [uncultured Photobacterium sp.]|uniref:flagellar hook-length control protein FliK n=1 Tax=uncultured Photobacterium sp. TaxID=173973 RepID=UPI002610A868|nr:flagellar hook-length control protein FliK [uncultured Photobacterium sp.]
MFSSRLLTSDTASPAPVKNGSAKASSALSPEASSIKNKDAGSFAEEFQATAGSKPKADKVKATEAASDVDEASGKSQMPGEQNGQNSISQSDKSDSELDSSKKQQIMSDGEEVLNRLSASNKQLAQSATSSSAGKDLPPEEAISSQDNEQPLANIKQTGDETTEKFAPGLNQEQLAKVFAAPLSKEAGNIEKVSEDEVDSDEAIAPIFVLGTAASAVAAEVKNMQQASQQSGDLLQSAGNKAAELNLQQQQALADTADMKGKLESVFATSALATANAGQPQFSDAEASIADLATGSAAMAAALEAGGADNGGAEAKSDISHTLSGLTTSQGQTLAQARAEAAQTAQAQSPLQLSKEQAGDELAERVQMMMSKNLKHVDIRLDPPELGKLQIKLSLNQDQASVQFTVGNQQTRDLVEQAMPRLRELLNQQGLQLAQSSVQQDNARQSNQHAQGQQNGRGGQSGSGSAHQGEAELGSAEPIDMYVSQSSDRVDYYA